MRINNSVSGFSSPQVIEQLHQARLVRITHGRFAIWLDPFRMLYPKIVMNLLPEFGVSVDLMMQRRWPGERFIRRAEWFVRLVLSPGALPFETDEFHERLSSGDDWFTPAQKPFVRTTHSSGNADVLNHRRRRRGLTGHVAHPSRSIRRRPAFA
jgi:hypothetical protein